jgi:hypothetical protein
VIPFRNKGSEDIFHFVPSFERAIKNTQKSLYDSACSYSSTAFVIRWERNPHFSVFPLPSRQILDHGAHAEILLLLGNEEKEEDKRKLWKLRLRTT